MGSEHGLCSVVQPNGQQGVTGSLQLPARSIFIPSA
jgi:hypothetical protein